MTTPHTPSPHRMSFFSELWLGASLPLRALRLLAKTPKLWLWALIPIAATLTIYALLLQTLSQWFFPAAIPDPTFWQKLAQVGFWVVGLTLAALTFSALAQLLSTPVNDLLAESTERYTTPPLDTPPGGGLSGFARRIWLDLLRSLLALVLTVLVAILGLIPLGIHLPVLFLIQAQIVTFNALAFPMTRRQQTVRATLRLQAKHWGAGLGFGGVILLIMPVPILNLLVVPLSVMGGTLLFGAIQPSE